MTCNYTSFYQIARTMLNYSSIWHPLSVVFANEKLAPRVMLYPLEANMQYPHIINLQLHFYHVVQHAIHFRSIIQGKQCKFMDECTNMNVIFECKTFEYSMCLRINVKLGSLYRKRLSITKFYNQ